MDAVLWQPPRLSSSNIILLSVLRSLREGFQKWAAAARRAQDLLLHGSRPERLAEAARLPAVVAV